MQWDASAQRGNKDALTVGDVEASGGSVFRAVGVVLRRWYIFLGAPIAAATLAYVWAANTVPIYTAQAQVLIDPRRERIPNMESVVSELALDASSLATEVALIGSFSNSQRAVDTLTQDELRRITSTEQPPDLVSITRRALALNIPVSKSAPGSGPQMPAPAQLEPTPAGDGFAPQVRAAIGIVQAGTSARRIGATYLIEISFRHHDRALAARLANAMAEAYIAEALGARYTGVKRAAAWLNDQVTTLREKVAGSERAVAEHHAKHNLASVKFGVESATVAASQVAEINAQLAVSRAQTVEKKSKFEQAQRVVDSGAPLETVSMLLESPIVMLLRQKEAELAGSEADQRTRLGAEHPSIIRIRAERADIRNQMSREIGRLIVGLKTEYEFALRREESLEASRRELMSDENRNDVAVIRARELEREVQSNRAQYDSLMARLQEAQRQTTLHISESRIVSLAMVPSTPSYPNTQRFVLLGLAGGLAFAFGAAFLLEQAQRGFTTAEQIEDALQLPVLTVMPMVSRKHLKIGSQSFSIPEYTAKWPMSQIAEHVRAIRVGAGMSSVNPAQQILLVVSALPSEGKTTLTTSLAISAAVAGQRTLLIDCDLRNPSVNGQLARESGGVGLGELLRGEARIEDLPQDKVQGLTILNSGQSISNPADVLGSERFVELLQALCKRYDAIYIDAPPLVPVIDGALLAKVVDKILLVIQWRSTPRVAVLRALRVLGAEQQKLVGVVMNRTSIDQLPRYGASYLDGYKNWSKYYNS